MRKNEDKEEKKSVKLADVVSITLRHWPWIVVSVMVCIICAVLYIMSLPPLYSRDAAVIIKDDNQSGSALGSQFSAFASMGMFGNGLNIRDEINKLQSPDLMKEVVKRLDLNTTYEIPGRLRDNLCYGDSLPIIVSIPQLKSPASSMTLKIARNGDISIKEMAIKDDKVDVNSRQVIKFDTPAKTPLGTMVVSKGPKYEPGKEYTILWSHLPLYKATTNFSNAVDIRLQDIYGNTIEMSILDPSIQRAEDILNTIIEVYNENWVENKNLSAMATTKFINQRLVSLEKELGGVDKDIADFQSVNLMPDVNQTASMYIKNNQVAEQAIFDLTNRLQIAQYMRQFVTDAANKHQILPNNVGLDNTTLTQQISEYNRKLMERNRLAINSSENHPVITALENDLDGMRVAIIAALNNTVQNLNAQLRNAQGEKDKAQARLAGTPGQATHLLGIGREQKVKENLYLFLLQKREENELSRTFTAYNTEIIASPYGDTVPVAPRKVVICAAAFLMGLIIPFFVTFMIKVLNTKVRTKSDLEPLGMPILGEIPAWHPSKKYRRELEEEGLPENIAVRPGNRNVINDAFRVLRANLRFMLGDNKHHAGAYVLMMTSLVPGSGKSFISANLAVSLALRHAKVLVIDGDLRHGSSSEIVKSPSRGISNYLNGGIDDINSVIVHNVDGLGINVLPVGHFPPNPTELLEGERFKQLIEQLRNEYDYIIIDCPPYANMADAKIINTVSDCCLFVVRVGLFRLADLDILKQLYTDKELKSMSLILNGTTDGNTERYGYADNYHKNDD
ncbi:MAG: polysaccharide biosynthesis tyrosine autokinase [Muribaculaceae bacterium]|nr:polysaccharide biosynthesis tyrosine autokinase [Muribaculaceae bacterium]